MGRTKAIAIFVALSASISAYGLKAQQITDEYMPPWGISFKQVHQAVTADIFDHRSAQYRGMVLAPVEDGNILCGWVNWRDDGGVYGPYVTFYYKAQTGGRREAHLSSVDTEGEVPADVVAAGCDQDTLTITMRGHRLP